MSWIVSLPCTRAEAEALSGEIPELDALTEAPVVVTREIDEDAGLWQLDAYMDDKPGTALIALLQLLLPSAKGKKPVVEELVEQDWVTLSQQGLKPVQAGRFFVHTSSYADRVPQGTVPFLIDASQAFGTGGHDTTAGCLAMLDRLARQGASPRNIADIGTGTGLLAFAAMHLWPEARAIASDIDPVCGPAVEHNAATNGLAIGDQPGELAMVIAEGLDDARLQARAPYDLVIANILAGPLIDLAPDVANVTAPQGHAVLSGLLGTQAEAVAGAYRDQGFALEERLDLGDWTVLRLCKTGAV